MGWHYHSKESAMEGLAQQLIRQNRVTAYHYVTVEEQVKEG